MNSFLENLFNKRDKAISDSSKTLYARNLTKLNGGESVTDLKFLNDMKKVLLIIDNYKPTTKRSFIIAACVVLKNNNEKLYQQYYELLSKMNTDLAVRTDKSETQRENWMDQDDVEKLLESLNVTKKVSNNDDYQKMLNHLILSLYVLQIPRRNQDYCLMKIASDMTNTDFNYLDIKNKKFIFNNYKTDGKYKSVEIDIEENMFKVIQKYLKFHPDKLKLKNKKYKVHFLVDFFNRPVDKSNDITKILNKVFGKKISSSMLRNIYLSSKYSKMMNELKEDTSLMATSVSTAMNNYIKK